MGPVRIAEESNTSPSAGMAASDADDASDDGEVPVRMMHAAGTHVHSTSMAHSHGAPSGGMVYAGTDSAEACMHADSHESG